MRARGETFGIASNCINMRCDMTTQVQNRGRRAARRTTGRQRRNGRRRRRNRKSVGQSAGREGEEAIFFCSVCDNDTMHSKKNLAIAIEDAGIGRQAHHSLPLGRRQISSHLHNACTCTASPFSSPPSPSSSSILVLLCGSKI